MAVMLMFWGVLLPGFAENSMQHLFAVTIYLFLKYLIKYQLVQPYGSVDTASAHKKCPFHSEIRFPYDLVNL